MIKRTTKGQRPRPREPRVWSTSQQSPPSLWSALNKVKVLLIIILSIDGGHKGIFIFGAAFACKQNVDMFPVQEMCLCANKMFICFLYRKCNCVQPKCSCVSWTGNVFACNRNVQIFPVQEMCLRPTKMFICFPYRKCVCVQLKCSYVSCTGNVFAYNQNVHMFSVQEMWLRAAKIFICFLYRNVFVCNQNVHIFPEQEMCLRATERPKVHRRGLSAVTSKGKVQTSYILSSKGLFMPKALQNIQNSLHSLYHYTIHNMKFFARRTHWRN